MPSQKRQPIELTATSTMLYVSVDNYSPHGTDDNSVRTNNHHDLNDFSSQSIICAMDRFVKAVNNMNETIMVPCRLLDIDVNSQKTSAKVPKLLKGGGDPYNYYGILNSVKNDLIWGATSNDEDNDDVSPPMTPSINSTRWPPQEEMSLSKKQPFRRQSTLSLISVSSNTSEGESEGGSECNEEDDRSTESDEGHGSSVASTSNVVTENLRTHLIGLHSCLKNLTETATYITDCYQEVVNI